MADDLDTYNPVRGPARELIDAQELADAEDRAAVILDRRRRRARYREDHFLTARDLTRGQQYTLLRQADLAQLSGGGIVHGLELHTDAKGTQLRIDPGLGIARTGESMALREGAQLTVAKLRVVEPESRPTRLVAEDASTGPGTGMYLLVAHPVEYSRNAVATFPNASVAKIVHADTEIVEGTWFTLMPVPSPGKNDVLVWGRARLAREVFVGGFDPTLATDGLAIAVVGIVNGRVQWVDQALTGRSVGADAVVGFGLQSRKGRLAYQAQYARHLGEELERRRNAGLPDGLPAVEAFAALPPVGPLPRGAVEVTATEVRQSFFPREIYVEMAIMPEDELPALLSEGLIGAPIDLEAGSEALEGVPVLIVVPVPRMGFDQQTPRMEGVYRSPAIATTGRQVVKARPIDALLVLRRKNEPEVWSDPSPLDLEAWRKAVESASQLWYVRRSQFATTSVVVPRSAPTNDDVLPIEAISAESSDRLEEAGEVDRFNHLFGGTSKLALVAMDKLLSNPIFDGGDSPSDAFAPATETSIFISAMMGELAYLSRRLRPPSVIELIDQVPTSPVFAELAVGNRLRLRPIELGDVERVAQRFTAGFIESLRGPTFRSPVLRSVLATSAVVPELALWVTNPEGMKGAVNHIASLAESADIAKLRSIASNVSMPSIGQPVDPPGPEDTPVEEALSYKMLDKIGEVAALRAIWKPSDPTFRTRLDKLLATSKHGDAPLFAAATLMPIVTIGYELESKTDEQVVAILDQLVSDGEFEAPNGSKGKVLGLEQHGPRDAVLKTASKVSAEAVTEAQARLSKWELGEPSKKELELSGGTKLEAVASKLVAAVKKLEVPKRPQHSELYRLLALASGGFEHITNIASATEAQMEAFQKAALEALKARSVTKMRKAASALLSKS
ncbi:MAG TPA: hypothetical protein VM869_30370 [Enhygromyxa sp.]|nr:hypothetical protein [Enhygromyxa sp.]